MKKFNTTGPCFPDEHYMLPALDRLPGIHELVAGGNYFVIHAPRQTGKTTALKALAREIKEELNADITVGDLLVTVEHDYTDFHLSMQCFWAELKDDSHIELLEHEAAKWLSVNELGSVEWLPADIKVVEAIKG